MSVIKKHTVVLQNGNTITTIKFLGIPVVCHEKEKEENTILGRLSTVEKRIEWNTESIQRFETRLP